ncbi:MAG: PAS domain S-box protein, partial [Candidatus Binatia bacterium]
MDNELIKILLIEDNSGDARLLQEAVMEGRTEQFALTHVESLSDALQRLREERFAAILADLGLPDSNGLRTVTQLFAQAPDVPVIVLTGSDDEALAIKAVQNGAQDYLTKGQVESSLLGRTIYYAIERQRLRQELRASERRYRELIENASDAIVSYDVEGIFTIVNQEMERMLDWSRNELIGQPYRKVCTPDGVALGEDYLRRLRAGELLPEVQQTAELVRKDGSLIPIEFRTRVIHDNSNQPIGIQSTFRDISVRKASEQQRADFLAMLTHDIKNPLTVIVGHT